MSSSRFTRRARTPCPGWGRVAAIALCALTACSQPPEPPPAPRDTWYRALDNPAHEFVRLPLYLYSPVTPELVAEATAALGDGPLLQLSTSEARRYATDPLRTVRELRPFLIHGLYRSKRAFRVSIADRALWVDSVDDPLDPAPVKRQPLVIYIDEVPPDVYVTTGAATAALPPPAQTE